MKVYIINPTKGRKQKTLKGGSSMIRRRKKRRTRRVKRKAYRRNPVRRVKRRTRRRRITAVRRRRTYRRNPSRTRGLLKTAFSRKHVINILSLGVGFVGGIKAQKYINGVEAFMNFRRWTGLIPFILGTIVAVRGKSEAVKSVGAGLSLSGMYDLVTQNIPQIGLAPVEGVDLDDTMYQGTAIDLEGTNAIDLEGEDDVMVGDHDDIDVVGDDGSPYAMV